jgi:hypothetical protein
MATSRAVYAARRWVVRERIARYTAFAIKIVPNVANHAERRNPDFFRGVSGPV